MKFQLLEWDTNLFGFIVARIIPKNLCQKSLRNTIENLAANNVKLAYWSSTKKISNEEIKSLSGLLVDKKTTFTIDLNSLDPGKFISTNLVINYDQSMPTDEMIRLAFQCGAYSRFAIDPKIPKGIFEKLYKNWILKSLNNEIADSVLVILDNNEIAGMITLGHKNNNGDIGLLSVEAKHRGKGYGEMLVRAAQKWFIDNGYESAQVVTQESNTAACQLYKKCGYSINKIEYLYHFWIQPISKYLPI